MWISKIPSPYSSIVPLVVALVFIAVIFSSGEVVRRRVSTGVFLDNLWSILIIGLCDPLVVVFLPVLGFHVFLLCCLAIADVWSGQNFFWNYFCRTDFCHQKQYLFFGPIFPIFGWVAVSGPSASISHCAHAPWLSITGTDGGGARSCFFESHFYVFGKEPKNYWTNGRKKVHKIQNVWEWNSQMNSTIQIRNWKHVRCVFESWEPIWIRLIEQGTGYFWDSRAYTSKKYACVYVCVCTHI